MLDLYGSVHLIERIHILSSPSCSQVARGGSVHFFFLFHCQKSPRKEVGKRKGSTGVSSATRSIFLFCVTFCCLVMSVFVDCALALIVYRLASLDAVTIPAPGFVSFVGRGLVGV